MKIHEIEIDSFTAGALGTLLWSEMDEEGDHFDDLGYGIYDIAKNDLLQFKNHCEEFQSENADLLEIMPAHNGHNFILSCNGHGSGFFDEYMNWKSHENIAEIEKAGDLLQEKAREFGEKHLYLGDDEKLYIAFCW